MSNELIFIITAIGIFGFIRYCFFQGRRWLQASIVINLILISVFGAKLISIFGIITNVGNIFYAAVFFAGQLLVEHYGKNEGKKSVWLGFASLVLFVIVGQLTVRYAGIPDASGASEAIATLFKFTPRIAAASMLAYLCAQSLNLWLYSRLRSKNKFGIWYRSIVSIFAGQAIDSLLFFSIAFWGTVPQSTFFETMLAGFVVKFVLGVISVPFLYSSYTIKTQEEILEEEAEAILLSIGDGLVITDKDGRIVSVNKAFEEILGWTSTEVLRKQMTEVLRRYDEFGREVPHKKRVLTRVLEGEKMVTPSTNHTFLEKKNGTKFPVRIIVTPVLVDDNIIGAVEIFQDVTKEKEIEKLRTDFLMLASHQLRTPLSGTRWIVETFKKGILGQMNEKQNQYLDNLYQINSRMIKLVSDMLNVLRIESGSFYVYKEKFPLNKICEDIIEMVKATAQEKSVTIENHLKDKPTITAETDIKLAKIIILSFISNAINYSKNGGKIILDSEEFENGIVVSVEDDGIGIPKDEQRRIFERFYRGSNANLIKTDGTGLGLSISSTLAKKIGAQITFESTEGKGSIFYLHIPKVTEVIL
jgi:uncharacterized integral membrane protein (TIGR00697 family)